MEFELVDLFLERSHNALELADFLFEGLLVDQGLLIQSFGLLQLQFSFFQIRIRSEQLIFGGVELAGLLSIEFVVFADVERGAVQLLRFLRQRVLAALQALEGCRVVLAGVLVLVVKASKAFLEEDRGAGQGNDDDTHK